MNKLNIRNRVLDEIIEIREMVDLLPIRQAMGPRNADRLKERLKIIEEYVRILTKG